MTTALHASRAGAAARTSDEAPAGDAAQGFRVGTADSPNSASRRDRLRSFAKRVIVAAACREVISPRIAEWLIKIGGLSDA